MKTERRYDIDWLRVIAIGFLLIYHIAIIFQPWAMFLAFVRSNELLEGLWKPMTMLNVWRIPLLFYVSGMGLFFALKKRNAKQLLLERSKRILIPFLFGCVAIVPLHMYIFQKFYNMPLSYYVHTGHLWFLGNIFIYVLLWCPLFFYLKKHPENRLKSFLNKLLAHPLGPIALSLLMMAEVVVVQPDVYALYAQTWHGFFLGLFAFLLGFLFVYSGATFWNTLLKWKWMYLILACTLFGVRYTIFQTEAPGYLMSMESSVWIYAFLGLAYQYLNKPSAILSYLSKAAYPVYIIHMLVLYLGGLFILPLAIPAFVQFICITIFTFLGCLVLYEFMIRRVSFLRPLFGLDWKKTRTTESVVDTEASL